MINPHKVHLSEEVGSFWHGNTVYMESPMWDGNVDRKTYSFAYRRPFRRPHSISLGVHGIVKVGIEPFSEMGRSATTSVEIVKGDSISPRNKHYSYRLTHDYMLLATEVFEGDIGFEEVARLGVANAITAYSQEEHVFIWAARRVLNELTKIHD